MWLVVAEVLRWFLLERKKVCGGGRNHFQKNLTWNRTYQMTDGILPSSTYRSTINKCTNFNKYTYLIISKSFGSETLIFRAMFQERWTIGTIDFTLCNLFHSYRSTANLYWQATRKHRGENRSINYSCYKGEHLNFIYFHIKYSLTNISLLISNISFISSFWNKLHWFNCLQQKEEGRIMMWRILLLWQQVRVIFRQQVNKSNSFVNMKRYCPPW